VPDRVLQHAVDGHSQSGWVDRDPHLLAVDLEPASGSCRRPPPRGLAQQLRQVDLDQIQRRVLGTGEPQQSRHGALELVQLLEDDVQVLARFCAVGAPAEQLREAASHRDRRTQLVRREAYEPALGLPPQPLSSRHPARLGRCCHPPPNVPDHDQEQQRHERDLARLLPTDETACRMQKQRHARDDRDHSAGQPREP